MEVLYTVLSSAVTALVFVVGWSVIIGRKLQVIDDLKDEFDRFRTDIRKELDDIRADIKGLIQRISNLEGKMQIIYDKKSPWSPTELGALYLKESGLEDVLNDRQMNERLREKIRSILPKDYLDYDVEQASRRTMLAMDNPAIVRKLKNFAYQHGMNIEVLLTAAAFWLRDDFLGVPRTTLPGGLDKKI